MKLLTKMLVVALFVAPFATSAQTITTVQVNQLLQEDLSTLIALNGEAAVREYLAQIIIFLSQQLSANELYGGIGNGNSSNDDDEPDVETENARDIDEDSAELNGSVDMNDFRNGIVFFLWGEDEDEVEDATDEDEYGDIRERGDDLQKQRVDSDLDDDEDYELNIRNLDEDTDYYFVICVEYEDEDDDETLECGDIEEFETDGDNNSNNNDEPRVETLSARDVEDDRAELRGSVDMNDFRNGIVFFLWGEDEDEVEDATQEDEYDDIDEDGDDLQKQRVDSDLDGEEDYELEVRNLDDDTDHFFALCVEYEDEDDDETLECGDIEEFETDN